MVEVAAVGDKAVVEPTVVDDQTMEQHFQQLYIYAC